MTVSDLIKWLTERPGDAQIHLMQEHNIDGQEWQFESELRDYATGMRNGERYVILIGSEQ